MNLGDLIFDDSITSLSFIGMSKNAGKTVTLKKLLSEQGRFPRVIGITSMGRDGEEEDALAGREKPRLWLEAGMLVASAADLLIKSSAGLEILENSGVGCALGPIYLARITGPGYVEVAGPSVEKNLKKIVRLMHEYGASLVFVDGAFDRQVSASPAVTDATLLASGLALHPDPETVIGKTACRVEQLTIPPVPEELGYPLRRLSRDIGAALLKENGEAEFLPLASALGNEAAIIRAFSEASRPRALLILGAVVDATLAMLMDNREIFGQVPVIVKNGACLFVEEGTWRRFKHRKTPLLALEPITVKAVTLNPTSPGGRHTLPQSFVTGMSTRLPHIPVFDPVASFGALGGEPL